MYQSKWGYHPCDYEGFKRLKRIQKAYWQGLHLIAKHKRWERKSEKHRFAEPECPEIYRCICASDIINVYNKARHGASSPESVSPISASFMHIVGEWIAELDLRN